MFTITIKLFTLNYQFHLQITWIVFNIATMEDVSPKTTNLFVCAIPAIRETIVPKEVSHFRKQYTR